MEVLDLSYDIQILLNVSCFNKCCFITGNQFSTEWVSIVRPLTVKEICLRMVKKLTCEAISHKSWSLCNAPSAVWSKSPALCTGSPSPASSQCLSEPKYYDTFKYAESHQLSQAVTLSWKKVASLHRWGFLWSVSGGSLWRRPHYWGSPAGQSPAPRPCPGLSGHSPSPDVLFLQNLPPEQNKTGSTVELHCREHILTGNLHIF